MLRIDPNSTPTKDLHQFLLGIVAPRPIAFVSTIDDEGRPNVAPYSFFNAFSSNPPIVVFSSNRRVKDNTTKDTLANIKANGEVVINAVNHQMVRQMALASVQYPPGVSEFEKSGLTPLESELVKPFRVMESPAHMECRVKEIITLGEHGGAGHLIICDVLRIHVSEAVIGEKNRIDPHKMDLMGRMGRAYYVRASGEAVQTIFQAVEKIPIGYDGLPPSAQNSQFLTGNELGILAGQYEIPHRKELDIFASGPVVHALTKKDDSLMNSLQIHAKECLARGDISEALLSVWLADRYSSAN